MALSSATVWECRTSGNDLNGGGFRAGAPGVDYSLQSAPQLILTDCTASGTATLTSATGGFTAAMVGNLIQISGGTLAAGFYEIAAVSNANTATLDRSPGTGSGSTGRVGGALATINRLASAMIPSNKAFVRAGGTFTTTSTISFSQSVSPSATAPPSRLIGYATTRGDGGAFALTIASGTNVTALSFPGSGWVLENAWIDCGGLAGSSGITLTGQYSDARWCRVVNHAAYGILGSVGDTAVSDCEVTGGLPNSIGIAAANPNVKILRNYVHDNQGTGISVLWDDVVAWNVVVNNTGASSDGIRIRFGSGVMYNTVHGNGRHGINKVDNDLINGQVRNNILSQNGGYGFVGGLSAGLPADSRYDGNAYYNNALGTRQFCDDASGINAVAPYVNVLDVVLTASPFANAAANDYSLNNVPGGGALCRASGTPRSFPGLAPRAYMDLGALQHRDSGSFFLEG